MVLWSGGFSFSIIDPQKKLVQTIQEKSENHDEGGGSWMEFREGPDGHSRNNEGGRREKNKRIRYGAL